MEDFAALFQVQMQIARGIVDFPAKSLECSSCGVEVENECANCGQILVPNGLPYLPAEIVKPDHGWVAIEPTFCGDAPMPLEARVDDVSAIDRAKLAFKRHQLGLVRELQTKRQKPRLRLVMFGLTDVLLITDNDD